MRKDIVDEVVSMYNRLQELRREGLIIEIDEDCVFLNRKAYLEFFGAPKRVDRDGNQLVAGEICEGVRFIALM